MKSLLELIKLIFGPKAISKTIGTRTNVIKLPNNKIKRYTKQDLDIESASDAAAMNAKKEMEELVAEIPKMNDAERLVFEGNLRRLKNRLGIRSEKDPTADVYEFGTKLKATPKGIETLTEQAGQKSPPGTLMGDLESSINKLKASGKELEDIAKEKGGVKFSIPEEGIFNQELSADNLFDTIIKQQEKFRKIQNSGLVTSTAREILQRDIKAGKLKLPKEIEDRIMLVDGNPGTVNPVEVFRTNYGEDALEQVDSLIPELANAQSYSDLVKIVEKKYPMKPLAKPRKETMSLDEATKAEEENILTPKKPEEPEEFATGGRVGYMGGGSTGLDYLMGIDRTNYQSGGMTLEQLQAKAPPGEFVAYINPEEAGVLKALGGSGKKINGIPSFFASSPGDTGGAGGADGAGGNDEGGGGDGGGTPSPGDTGGAGGVGPGSEPDPGSGDTGPGGSPTAIGPSHTGYSGLSVMGQIGANIASNPLSAALSPLSTIAKSISQVNQFRAALGLPPPQAPMGTEGDDDRQTIIQKAIADPLGLNANISNVDELYNQYRTNVGFQSGGRVGFKDGSKLPKEKTTLPINPMMDEGVDLNKRGFLKGAAGVGAGIAALGTGALRLARKGAKKAKDLDIIFSKNFDGEYIDGSPQVYTSIYSNLVPHTKKAKNFLEDMAKQKKVVKNSDGSYSIHINDMPIEGDVKVLKDLKDKFDFKTYEHKGYIKNKKGEYVENIEEIDDLRSYNSPLINDATYGPSYFEDDAAEYAADILQPKTAKEIIKERADLIERKLKQRGNFASGGLSYLQGI